MRIFLFDIDGTLLTTQRVGNLSLAQSLRDEFGVDQPSTDISFSGRTDWGLMIELLQRNGLPPSIENCKRLRQRYASLMGDHLRRQGGSVLPGVRQLLSELSHHDGLSLAIMTGNFPETATQKLRHFDLRRWFAWISGGDSHADRDDLARRTLDVVRRRHRNGFDEVIVVGDTPADIRCGRAIGAKTVGVATGEYSLEALDAETPDHLFPNLTDTAELMRILQP